MSSTTSQRLEHYLWRAWYWYATGLLTRDSTRHDPITFLNYGYVDLDDSLPLNLESVDEPNRLCIQLYDRVVRQLELQGRDVLEVSCGHGGGAFFLMRYTAPNSLIGLDLNPRAIGFCQRHYAVNGLSFLRGNAEALPFDDQSVDVVVNIEASHRYRDVNRFLGEVTRVLRPGGHLAIADLRLRQEQDLFREQLTRSGLYLVSEASITDNVSKSLALLSDVRFELIQTRIPKLFRSLFRSFAGVEGTNINRLLLSREAVYLHFVLQKPLGSAGVDDG